MHQWRSAPISDSFLAIQGWCSPPFFLIDGYQQIPLIVCVSAYSSSLYESLSLLNITLGTLGTWYEIYYSIYFGWHFWGLQYWLDGDLYEFTKLKSLALAAKEPSNFHEIHPDLMPTVCCFGSMLLWSLSIDPYLYKGDWIIYIRGIGFCSLLTQGFPMHNIFNIVIPIVIPCLC